MTNPARFLLAFLLASACGASPAPAPTTPAPTPAAAASVPGPFLWQVEGKRSTLYLYGTIHTGGAGIIPVAARDKMRDAGTFASELDTDNVDPGKLMARAQLPAGRTLADEIGKPAFDALVKKLPAAAPRAVVERMKPWFVAVLLLMSSLEPSEAPDAILLKEARAAGKQVYFLETIDGQLDVLAGAIGAKDLVEMVDKLDTVKTTLTAMLDAYKKGDHAALERHVLEPTMGSKDSLEALIFRRNDVWAPQLEQLMIERKGSIFVAVGAAHLLGPRGVPALLAKKGYRVTRVMP